MLPMTEVDMNKRVEKLMREEELLRYPERFGASEALELGCAVAELSVRYDRGLAVRIYRESDGGVIFQWMMDDKAERNLAFIDGKRLSAKACGHASLLAGIERERCECTGKMYEDVPGGCADGGAFPIRLASTGEWAATVAVSGLHDGGDHIVVVDAISRALDITL